MEQLLLKLNDEDGEDDGNDKRQLGDRNYYENDNDLPGNFR